MSSQEPLGRPIFVLCAARSGSTLLRYVLDAHPEVCCPAELNVAEVFVHVAKVYSLLVAGSSREQEPQGQLPREAIDSCRAFADSTIGLCARSQHKRRWADKSLVNAPLSELIHQVFPEAHYLCLFRDCADFITSAHEASPWGLSGYGFEPYARETPANAVVALARYWADNTEAMLRFADTHPKSCQRVRYEDLVRDPQATLSVICDFLGVSEIEIAPNKVFDEELRMHGAQDHKIAFTSGFECSSIGQGWRVPTEMIPPPLTTRIDGLAERLGYRPLDGQLESAVLGSGTEVPVGVRLPAAQSDGLRSVIEEALSLFFASTSAGIGDLASLKLLVPDIGGCWIVDFKRRQVRQAEEICASAVIAHASTLAAIISGETNPAVAVRRGNIRAVGPAEPGDAARVQRHLDAFLGELNKVAQARQSFELAATPQLVEV